MQPYLNPNYFTQYQQSYNPYMQQRLDNLQQFQQAINTPTMQNQQFTPLGKIVESIDMVKATDIPMDGSMYYFPMADGSAIHGKQWLPTGQTRILTFKPLSEDNPNNLPLEVKQGQFDTFNAILGGIQDDIKALTDKVDKISRPTRSKKEVSEDE